MGQTFFSPNSVFWRVNRESLSSLAGPRAVLMQIAHPLVAAGVAEHSQFRKHRLLRLYRTSIAATAITFGSRDIALRMIRLINRKHLRVRGVLQTAAGPFPQGTQYDANDPELKLWVLSTITESTLLLYDSFVAPLSNDEREEYYRDSLTAARLFGIPHSITPSNYREFLTYMRHMLDSNVITVGDQGREIAKSLFSENLGRALRLASSIGIGLLPVRLRKEFGFRWTPRRERWLRRSAFASRHLRGHIPTILCSKPVATLAELRRALVG